jgi:hypothetical protein
MIYATYAELKKLMKRYLLRKKLRDLLLSPFNVTEDIHLYYQMKMPTMMIRNIDAHFAKNCSLAHRKDGVALIVSMTLALVADLMKIIYQCLFLTHNVEKDIH